MLVLSRKTQERIQIGDQITISVLAVKGNVVRIGIEAPTSIHIVRGELPPLDKPSNDPPAGRNGSDDGDEKIMPKVKSDRSPLGPLSRFRNVRGMSELRATQPARLAELSAQLP